MRLAARAIAALILAAAMLMISTAVAVSAAEPVIAVGSAKGAVGNEIAVNVSLLNNPGITALSIQVGYSAEDLELLGIDDPGLFEDSISTSQLTQNPLTISWYASDSANKSAGGVFAILRFRVRNGAQSSGVTVSYDEDNIFNNAFDNILFSIENGQVTISQNNVTGDANGDGEITLIDVTMIQYDIAHMRTGVNPEVLMNGDVDGNGVLEITDATFILRHLVNMETPYAIGKAKEE